ncbi:MAG TPA: amino acid adenylation domain-containing protein, partial [Candidatus Kapabacteria bacterium]|nr:amino acid adenylation domain-containing protein [Candidatus Kapabacteria bacterium]
PLNLPTDYPRPAVQSFAGDEIRFEIEPGATAALINLALEQGTTLYMILISLYTILLANLSGQEDIIVGTPVAGRKHADIERIIGMFVNTLPLRYFPVGDRPFKEFLAEVKQRTLEAFANQDYPYEALVDELKLERDVSRNPLFDTVFVMQNTDRPDINIPGLELETYEDNNIMHIAKFDLTLQVFEKGDRLVLIFEYCTMLFKEETIQRFAGYLKRILSAVSAEPGKKLAELGMISEEEKAQLLFKFNDTAAAYPEDKTIHQLFKEQVSKTPDNIALVGADLCVCPNCLTYCQLDRQSNYLANILIEKGVLPDDIVAIKMKRSIEMIIGLLGILKAGGAYLPIDPEYPQERIDYMLKDSKAKLTINYEFLKEAPQAPLHHSKPKQLAYIIYTSGTTGRPKGSLIEHRNVVRLLFNDKFQFNFTEQDVWTLFHSFCFDFSVWEMYGALLYGGKLLILPKMMARDTVQFLELLNKEAVTVLNQTPSAFYNLVNETLNAAPLRKKLYLKYVIFGGEALNPLKLKSWAEQYPQTRLINMYGITETTVHVTYKEITGDNIELKISNIGKPIPTLNIYLLDKYLKPVPIGVTGEIYVGGDGVARGYLNRPELTSEKFIKNRSYKSNKTYILYKTGDLAGWLPDGNIQFLGRIDHQVKIRGFRIELGEIESRLMKHPDIKDAVVLAIEENGDKYLSAYIVFNNESVIPGLREYLSKELPEYMIPTYFISLDKIPLTSNGKLDRKALQKPGLKAGENYIAPRDEIEKKLVEIWSEVLGQTSIGIDDDFFELGGHSLKATILTSKIHKSFNSRVLLAEIFKTPTIRGLSGTIRAAIKDTYVPIIPVEKKNYYPLSSAQKRLYILQQIDKQGIGYNIPAFFELEGEIDHDRLEQTFKMLIARHESLRTSFHMINDEPVQRIHDTVEFEIEKLDGRGDPLWSPFIRPFDLSQAPLLRVGLLKENEDKHILMVDMDHIISDGTSINILVKDFMALYRGEGLPELRVQYKDFSIWQNSRKQQKLFVNQGEYWLNELAGEIPILELPSDYARPPLQSFEGSAVAFEIDKEMTETLKKFVKETDTTIY